MVALPLLVWAGVPALGHQWESRLEWLSILLSLPLSKVPSLLAPEPSQAVHLVGFVQCLYGYAHRIPGLGRCCWVWEHGKLHPPLGLTLPAPCRIISASLWSQVKSLTISPKHLDLL